MGRKLSLEIGSYNGQKRERICQSYFSDKTSTLNPVIKIGANKKVPQ